MESSQQHPMRWWKLVVAYDGAAYHGWQWQLGLPTIQDQLERAWECVTGERIRMVGSGRTDAGVHALGQVASCASRTYLSGETLCRALNANLPADIRVQSVRQAPPGFDAISAAVRKRYRYFVQDGKVHDVFWRRHAWFVPSAGLDMDAMSQAAARLVGRHDFRAYQAAGSPRQSTVRTLEILSVERRICGHLPLIVFEAEADGFLYNMVRNLVGTLVQVGQGRHDAEWPARVLELGDRRKAGPTAPPHGLFLVHVELNLPPDEVD